MKHFTEGLKKYGDAIMTEIRNGITKTPLHWLKTAVIVFIPFLYAFTYLWAFYDPIPKAENLDLTIITSKDDALGDFVMANATNKKITIHNGPNVEMTANFKHIYDDSLTTQEDKQNVVKDSLLTIDVPTLDKEIVETIRTAIATHKAAAATPGSHPTYFDSLAASLGTFLSYNTLSGKPDTNYNYKKNFLIGFATDISSAQSGGINEVMSMLIDAISYHDWNNVITQMVLGNEKDGSVTGAWMNADGSQNSNFVAHNHQWVTSASAPTQADLDEFTKAMTKQFGEIKKFVGLTGGHTRNANAPNTPEGYNNAIEIITQHSQSGTNGHQAFGIGLSPFFISIGTWFGAVAMSLLVHRKIYNKDGFVRWRYMAKGTIINAGIAIQVSILMISLKAIGLGTIGYSQWAIMFGSAIFIGIIFGSFIMAIRLSIPSRSLSIYLIVIFMVLNIVCSGGLFPIQTQNAFVRAMNTWLPMHFSVEALRQGLVDTNWAVWGENIGYLSLYLLFVPIGIVLNFIYTHRWYIRYDFDMPKHILAYHKKWLKHKPRRAAATIKRLRDLENDKMNGGQF